jgi:hypothetical protein
MDHSLDHSPTLPARATDDLYSELVKNRMVYTPTAITQIHFNNWSKIIKAKLQSPERSTFVGWVQLSFKTRS